MHLRLTNHETFVACSQDQQRVLISALTCQDSSRNMMSGEPSMYYFWKFLNSEWMSFPSGLLEYVLELCRRHEWKYEVADHRTPPLLEKSYPTGQPRFNAYEDQVQVVDQMLRRGRGVLDLATNFGKTYVIGYFWFMVNLSSMLVLVPTTTLMFQTSRDLERMFGLPEGAVGRVGAGQMSWAPCTVSIANSVSTYIDKHGELPYKFETLFVDEGHLGVTARIQKIAERVDAFYRFWVSGTAYKDGQKHHVMAMTGLAGPLIAAAGNKYLVDAGRSARPSVNFIRVNTGTYTESDYPAAYKELKSSNYRNQIIRDLVLESNRNNLVCLVFVEHKDHMRRLKELMPFAEMVYGGSADSIVKAGLENRTIRCVIATSKWRVGVSIDGVDHVIHAGGMRASTHTLQEFGRALRKKSYGANRCWFTDFYDEWSRTLQRQSEIRKTTMSKQGFGVTMREPDQLQKIFA